MQQEWDSRPIRNIPYQKPPTAIGPAQLIQVKIDEYKNPVIIKTLQEFNKSYLLFRNIRGDGNCFYRAVFFSYIETLIIIKSQSKDLLEMAFNRFFSLTNSKVYLTVDKNTVPQEFQSMFNNPDDYGGVQYIFQTGMIKIKNIMSEPSQGVEQKTQMIVDLLNNDVKFDFTTILLMREIAMIGYREFKQEISAFLLGNEEQNIKNYEIEGQDLIISIVANALKVPIRIEIVNKDRVDTINYEVDFGKNFKMFGSVETNYQFLPITLFFRPGHYDTCYSIDHSERYYSNLLKASSSIQLNQNLRQSNSHLSQVESNNISRDDYPQLKNNQMNQNQIPISYEQKVSEKNVTKYKDYQDKNYGPEGSNYTNPQQNIPHPNNQGSNGINHKNSNGFADILPKSNNPVQISQNSQENDKFKEKSNNQSKQENKNNNNHQQKGKYIIDDKQETTTCNKCQIY